MDILIMIFANDFEKNEFYGRESLKDLKTLYPEIFKYELHFTPNIYDDYDAYFFIIDKETQQIKKRVWIEIKIRYQVYDEWILEKNKLKQLIKKREELFLKKEEVQFIYLCFTPTSTFMWDVTNIDPNSTEKLVANKRTAISRTDKKEKDVIYLYEENSKKFDYIINEKRILSNYDNYLLEKVKHAVKKDHLFQYVKIEKKMTFKI